MIREANTILQFITLTSLASIMALEKSSTLLFLSKIKN